MGPPYVRQQVVPSSAVIGTARALEGPGPAVCPLVQEQTELAVEALVTESAGVAQGAVVPAQAVVQTAPESEGLSTCRAGVLLLAYSA